MVGFACLAYTTSSVLNAWLATATIFIALTVFTFQTKIDFSFLGAGLFVVLSALIWVNIIGFFIPYPSEASRAIAVIGVILFSLFILYDTSMIMHRVSPEDWVLAVVDLYLDILNLFLYLLRLLGSKK